MLYITSGCARRGGSVVTSHSTPRLIESGGAFASISARTHSAVAAVLKPSNDPGAGAYRSKPDVPPADPHDPSLFCVATRYLTPSRIADVMSRGRTGPSISGSGDFVAAGQPANRSAARTETERMGIYSLPRRSRLPRLPSAPT